MNSLKLGLGYLKCRLRKRPLYVAYRITNRCHLDCSYCPVKIGHDDALKKGEMNLSEIDILSKKLKEMGIPYILLTGGEPLIHENFLKIVKIMRSHELEVRLQTTGDLLTKELVDKLETIGINDFSLSVDSLEDTNSHFGGRKQNIKKTKDMIKHLTLKYPKGKTIVNTVISPNNIDDIIKIIKWVNENGAYSTISPISPNWGLNSDKNQELQQKLEKIIHQIIELKRHGLKIINTYRYFLDIKNALIFNKPRWKCHAYADYIEIEANGNVLPCSELSNIGNILDHNFTEKYKMRRNSIETISLRENCEGCLYACYREVSAIRSFQGLKDQLLFSIKNIVNK